MEGLGVTPVGALPNPDFWQGRKVLVTGHTGFKGGWLVSWLLEMRSRVLGYALKPETQPSFFSQCRLDTRMTSVIGDIRQNDDLRNVIGAFGPEIAFHLAAQPLVRKSYRDPVATFATNVMGTVCVLEALRSTPSVRAVVIVTSDKCYENREWVWGYREGDAMGGRDPYSASKACAELVTAAYRRSYFEGANPLVGVATVRAGNVIGGGDWANERLVPDAIKALQEGRPIIIRNPHSVRPWQHVLEPLRGYLILAERLHANAPEWSGGWNFGPSDEDAVSVARLTEMVIEQWGAGSWLAASDEGALHEAQHLKLDSSQARQILGWMPRLDLKEAVAMTAAWYRKASGVVSDGDMYEFTVNQIKIYQTCHLPMDPGR